MQYFIKIFNYDSGEFVGFYKETGIGCITKLPKGMKYFNDLETAFAKCQELDFGFLRERDGHYYTSCATVYGDSTREITKDTYRNSYEKEGEMNDALETFIRKNSPRNR